MGSNLWRIAAVVSLVVVGTGFSQGRALHVPRDYSSIRLAVDAAVSGDVVILAPGAYTGPDNTNISVTVDNLWIFGSAGAEQTVIDAAGQRRIFQVTNWVGGVVFDGITFRNGLISTSGGAIFADVFTDVIVNDCVFENNVADWNGGAIYAYAAEIDIFGSTFTGNSSGINGGCLAGFESSIDSQRCVFRGNLAGTQGGVYEANDYAVATFENCVMVDNAAPRGSALAPSFGAVLTVEQCVIAGNRSRDGAAVELLGGTLGGRIHNSILWNPASAAEIRDGESWEEANVEYSDVRGGWPGPGNIDVDPGFGSFRNFQYILVPGSPCIDAGDPSVSDGISDWHPRWPANYANGARSDMGAYGGPANIDWVR